MIKRRNSENSENTANNANNSTSGGGHDTGGNGPEREFNAYHTVQHSRNIRAVLFHPDGGYLLTAAPDPPRAANSTYTACRLYFYPLDMLLVKDKGSSMNTGSMNVDVYGYRILELISMPYLLPQVHLYSVSTSRCIYVVV